MNKFTLVLIFSFIAFIKGGVDFFNTEPYHSFDWLDEDEQKFTIKYSSSDTITDYFCYLYNQSKVCKPSCTPKNEDKTITCTLKGEDCGGDSDNPSYKYYYETRCIGKTTYTLDSKSLTLSEESKADDILTYLNEGNSKGDDVGVTIAVCSGSFLKYSMFLLSLLIL